MSLNKNNNNNHRQSMEAALRTLTSSHFDVDSRDCLLTLMKVIDNVLKKPGDAKVRSIRCGNSAFHKKVGSKRGGVEFLECCGFTLNNPAEPLLSLSSSSAAATAPNNNATLTLSPEHESTPRLILARKVLQSKALEIGIPRNDIPPIPTPPPPPPPPPSSSTTTTNNNQTTFDIYKGQSYNTQAAAVGANPNAISSLDGETYLSTTEREIQALTQKANRMERKLQSSSSSSSGTTTFDRRLCALKPGDTPPPPPSDDNILEETTTTTTTKDGTLLAQHYAKQRDERQKRENGGFTTKAMRDLERLKKQKVYSHAQLKIGFPDGVFLDARFLPKETINDVRRVISSALVDGSSMTFDLYVVPPRRVLKDGSTLSEEGLVPAAKVFVSWTGGGGGGGAMNGRGVGWYIKEELFRGGVVERSFPDAKAIAGTNKSQNGGGSASGGGGGSGGGKAKPSEEEMMKRMMGKGGGLFGGGKSKKKPDAKGGGKPKWFKG